MAITVANLMAQIGADLSQFRLGMNEVDARLQQVAVRARTSANVVANFRAQAQRAAASANAAAARRSAINLPKLQQELAQYRAAAAKTANDIAAAQQRATAAVTSGVKKDVDAAMKELDRLRKEAQKASADVDRAVAKMQRAADRDRSLALQEASLRARAGQLGQRASDYADLASASQAVNTTRAESMAQDAREHQIRALNNIAAAATRAGIAIEAALGVGVKVGADFNLQMTQAAHNTSLTAEGVRQMREAVAQMGMESGADLRELTEGFRLIENFGFSAAQSTDILRVAMKAAVATGADLSQTAQLLAQVMRNYRVPVQQAAGIMNMLVKASNLSKLELDTFVKSGGRALAMAHNMGVSLVDATAMASLFTRELGDAAPAMTNLINDMNKIANPTNKVKVALANLDRELKTNLTQTFTVTGLRARGLIGAFKDIVDAANKKGVRPGDLAAQLIPNLRGTQGGMAAANNMAELVDMAEKIRESFSESANVDRMYQESLKELGQQFGIVKNAFVIGGADIARSLTPALTNLIGRIRDLTKWWFGLSEGTRSAIVQLSAWGGAALIAFGASMRLIVGIIELSNALRGVGLSLGIVTAGFGKFTLAVAAAMALYKAYDLMVNPKYDNYNLNDLHNLSPDAKAKLKRYIGQYHQDYDEVPGYVDKASAAASAAASARARASAAKAAARQKYIGNLQKSLTDIDTELYGPVDAARRAALERDKAALLRDAKKNGVTFPDAAMPLNQDWLKGVLGGSYKAPPDPFQGLYDKQKKPGAPKVNMALRQANEFMQRLREQYTDLDYDSEDGAIADVEKMRAKNRYFQGKSNYYQKAKDIAQNISDRKKVLELNKEFLRVSEQLERKALSKDKVQDVTGAEWELEEGGLAKATQAQRAAIQAKIDAIKVNNDAIVSEKQYMEMLEQINKPLERQKTVLEQTFDDIKGKPELFARLGYLGAIAMAAMAQANHDKAEADKEAADASKELEERTQGYYGSLDQVDEKSHEVAERQKQLADKYRNVAQAIKDRALAAARDLDVADRARRVAEAWRDVNDQIERLFDKADPRQKFVDDAGRRFQGLAVGPEEVARAEKAAAAAWDAAQAAGVEAEMRDRVKKATERIADAMAEMHTRWVDLGHGLRFTEEEWAGLSDEIQKDAKKLAEALDVRDLIQQVVDGMEDMFVRMFHNIREHGFKSFFSDVLGMFEELMFEIAAKFLANQIIRMIIGAIGGADAVAEFGGGRAYGGPVQRGRAYLVGERRPEIFVPDSNGRILPSAGGGTTIIVHQTIVTPDANSFRRSEGQIGYDQGRAIERWMRRNR